MYILYAFYSVSLFVLSLLVTFETVGQIGYRSIYVVVSVLCFGAVGLATGRASATTILATGIT